MENERAVVVVAAATATAAEDADAVEVNERDGRTEDSGALLVESVGEWVLEEGWMSSMDMRAIERCGEVHEGGSSLYRGFG